MFWDILAYATLAALVILLLLAIIEPGPLAKPREPKPRRGRKHRSADEPTAPREQP